MSSSQDLSRYIDIGLSENEVKLRLLSFGTNTLDIKKKKTRWHLFLKQLKSPVIYVLIVATVIAFILGEHLDACAILAIVILNTIVGFIQEAKAEASLEALAAITAPRAKVLRSGVVSIVPSEEIVPGDILVLEAGDYVPADSRLLSAHQLSSQEGVLTGESLPVEKSAEEVEARSTLADRKNMVFAGTAISTGTARAVVIATGKKTEIGKIAEMMATAETPSTPMQLRLEIVGQKLLWLGLVVTIIVIIMDYMRDRPWVEILMSALSLSIAAIPEGLPTVVTIALVMAVKRMSKKRALVRKMDSVETLGATDVICTDKTGTLTTGKMQIRETYQHIQDDKSLFFLNMILCNNASTLGAPVGDATEIALLEFAREFGHFEEEIRSKNLRLYEWSFDSDRKRMSVACTTIDGNLILTKGAPESILSQCRLSDLEKKKIVEKITEFSRKGMRVLGFAWKVAPALPFKNIPAEEAESELIFLGLTAMADPPRKESMDAIRKCQGSGIRVIMITGDHPETAAAIAFELGITKTPSDGVMTGKELDTLDDKQLKESAEMISVYARVSPAHKFKLVTALKSTGHIVAMTGDGVNDAPALKIASIGVSMGKGGTEVARQASSMILTDDNFATIVDAVEEGRAVNNNIKRTLQYLLSTNLAELLFILIATAIGWAVPLLPVNLLWLNLVSDGLPSLALAAEVVPPEFLKESNRPSQKSFFDRYFYQEMILVGFIITFMCLGVYYYGLTHFDLLTARSLAFSFMVYVVLFRSFSCRSETRTFFEMRPNVYHLFSVVVPIFLQLLIQHFETLNIIFKIKRLSLQTNIILVLLGCVPVTLVELYKIWRRRKRESHSF